MSQNVSRQKKRGLKVPENLASFQTDLKVPRQSGNGRFPDWLKSFLTTENAYRQLEKFTDVPSS